MTLVRSRSHSTTTSSSIAGPEAPAHDAEIVFEPAVWQAVLSHGGYICNFTQVRGQTLRDVIRYFSSETQSD